MCGGDVQENSTCYIKEAIYEEGVKEGIWTSSDQTFLRVSMKVDSVCKNALGKGV